MRNCRYRKRGLKTKTWMSVIIILLTFAIPVSISYRVKLDEKLSQRLAKQVTLQAYASAKNPPTDPIRAYIKEVFGKDYEKAMLLLSCENPRLEVNAINVNTDGSSDISIFQVNNRWQGIQAKFLYNWKVNVLIAKQIFDESHSFKMWTCGQRLGI